MARWPGLLVAVLSLSATAVAQPQCPPLAASDNAAPFVCRFDAALTRLFTPARIPKDTYRVYVTDADIGRAAAAFQAMASPSNADGPWVVRQMDPLDAYGNAGPYNRAKVARLYVGIRARVARGPIVRSGRTDASITLVSPYPDPSLTRLERGTLIIELRIN